MVPGWIPKRGALFRCQRGVHPNRRVALRLKKGGGRHPLDDGWSGRSHAPAPQLAHQRLGDRHAADRRHGDGGQPRRQVLLVGLGEGSETVGVAQSVQVIVTGRRPFRVAGQTVRIEVHLVRHERDDLQRDHLAWADQSARAPQGTEL